MSDSDTLTLASARHAGHGIIRCGVIRAGIIVVGGDPRDIEAGHVIRFGRTGIGARREGSECRFSHAA